MASHLQTPGTPDTCSGRFCKENLSFSYFCNNNTVKSRSFVELPSKVRKQRQPSYWILLPKETELFQETTKLGGKGMRKKLSKLGKYPIPNQHLLMEKINNSFLAEKSMRRSPSIRNDTWQNVTSAHIFWGDQITLFLYRCFRKSRACEINVGN